MTTYCRYLAKLIIHKKPRYCLRKSGFPFLGHSVNDAIKLEHTGLAHRINTMFTPRATCGRRPIF